MHALTEIGSPGALQALERVIEDVDRDVRISRGARAHVARRIGRRSPASRRVVKGKALRDADLTEKMAFFEGYGALCGDAGVAQLDAILNGKGFLGRREEPEIRACAAIALGRVGTAKAHRGAAQGGGGEGHRRAQRGDSRAARRRGGVRRRRRAPRDHADARTPAVQARRSTRRRIRSSAAPVDSSSSRRTARCAP